MSRLFARLALFASIALGVAGCASPDPSLFTLSQVPGPTHARAPARIEIRSVSVARYLDRPQVVRSTSDNRVTIGGNERWGDPLASMLPRTIAENLSQRLPKALVFGADGAISVSPDAIVEVDVQRMDVDASGTLALSAQVAVTRGGGAPVVRSVRFDVRPASQSTHDLVRAMSTAIGDLSDVIAEMLS